MDKLFNPQSIAIIGASRSKDKLGYQILENIVKSGYKGKVFPINPQADEILNLKAYKTVSDVDEAVDLAIVIVPAPIVPEVLDECVKKSVANSIVISAGFSEIGPKGKILQDEISEIILKTSPMRVLGPNCLGIINTQIDLNATFAAPKLVKGKVGAVFQSGALGVALLDLAEKYQFGFSKFISLGNKVDLEESEFVEYLAEDPETKVIVLYLESIKDPKKFLNIARMASNKKPIIILKGGTTAIGARAAFSHTAAMVTSEHINKAIFSQSNLIVASSIEEMLNLIKILSTEPAAYSRNLAIITNAGGPGILATDAAAKAGMKIDKPNNKLFGKIKKVLPSIGSASNPFDLTGNASSKNYKDVLEEIVKDDQYSSIVVLLTAQTSTEVEKVAEILANYSNAKKPIVTSFLGDKAVEGGVRILKNSQVPNFSEPEEAVKALGKATKYWDKFFSEKNILELSENQPDIHPGKDALELLSRYNVPIPPSGMATNMDVAMKIVGRTGFPVAVKNISKDIVHKYKAGKVILNVQSEAYLKTAINTVGFPVLIQRMVDTPFEIIVGSKRDEDLGVLVTFGWGGVFAEDLDDISVRILPLTDLDLDEMIKETKIGRLLIKENVNLSPIKNIILDVCQIMSDYKEFSELDLNPIKVANNVAFCVDARFK